MSNTIRFGAYLDDKVSSSLDHIRDKFDKLGGPGSSAVAFGSLAAKGLSMVAGGALQAGEAVGAFLHSSIEKASALNETISKSQVVFGSAASGIEAWGKTAATSMGLSEQAAIEAAASVGNLLLSTGTAPAKIAPMSESIVKLAGDLASFNNIPVEDALNKLRSGLVGQMRPLRELGVAISAASVDTEAAALGFQKLNGKFSEGEKVQARYALIMEQTATSHGDFARTSDQLANSQRILTAEWDDAQAKLGGLLLPVAKEFVHVLEHDGVPAVSKFVDVIQGIGSASKTAADAFDFLSGANKATAESTDLLGDKTTALGQAIHWLAAQPGVVVDMINQTSDATRAAAASFDYMAVHAKDDFHQSSRATAAAAEAFSYMAVHIKDEVGATADAVAVDGHDIGGYIDLIGHKALSAEGQLAAAMTGMVSDVRKAKSELSTAASDAAKALWDPQIAKLEEYKNAREINDLQIKINSGKLNAKELLDSKIQIDTLKRDRIDLLATLADAGDKAAQQDLLRMAKVALATKTTTADQRAYWQTVIDKLGELGVAIGGIGLSAQAADYQATKLKDDLYKLPGLSSTRHPARAGGGPVSAGTAYTVGEMGSETFIPATNGTIIPHGQTTSSQPTVHTQIYLDGRIIADVVDEHLGRRYALRGSAAFSLGGA